jgi:UDP-N-acetylmuramoyl-L-alanyl-D-glutamate--2,6-diaminopimelate ligase
VSGPAGAGHGVLLGEIVERLRGLAPRLRGEPGDLVVRAVTFDHREVVPGALHCCLPGQRADGRSFAAAARAAGAIAFLAEQSLDDAVLTAPQSPALEILVPEGTARTAMALAACAFEGDPAAALEMVGVTGTNGKTTVTHLVRSVLSADGRPTAVIGTLSGARTTPESPHLQRRLAAARDEGCSAVAMEVTSHALVQRRVDGIRFDVAAFTNLSQDHLDFHGDMETYFQAKAVLFTPERSARAVVNADDEYGRRLLESAGVPTVAFRLSDAADLEVGPAASRFRLNGQDVRLRLGGVFNVANAVAAGAVAAQLGVAPAVVADGLSAADPVPGRFEAVPNDLGISVVVDYAHTPDGLTSVLGAARGAAGGGRVIVVFGCGGDRDRAKRPLMGRVATTLADVAVLTSDNPRSEDPAAIVDEVRAGCDGAATLLVEVDRTAAVGAAIALAEPGDVVVLAGKGHETTQELADRTIHLDDRELAAGALAMRAGAPLAEQATR